MADEDAKSNDRSVSTLVEAGKTKDKKKSKKRSNRNKIDYRVMVRCFIKFLTRVLKVCQENKIRHTDVASNVIPSLLDVILHCKWNKVSPIYIDQIVTLLGHLSVVSEKETEWVVRDLIAVVKSPWRRPLITSMLHGVEDLKIEEVFDLLAKEGLLVVNRVRSLLENKLSKLCLNYLTWVYRCFTWDKRPIQNTISLPNKQFIFDIYIILLNDLKSIRDVFNVLKSFSNDEIMLMVDRLRNDHNRSDIALQVVNMLVLKMSINVLESNEHKLYSRLVQIFCEMSTKRNDSIVDLKKQLNSVCKLTSTSDHIYAIAQELFKQFPTNREVVTFVIELYIRGLTTDANALDKAKCVLKEPETVRELGNKLSRVFQEVASIFPEYELRREFILNAFCVNPCTDTFKVLENVAYKSPQKKSTSILPDNCSWHNLSKPGTHLCVMCGGLFTHDDDDWIEETPVYDEPDPTKLLDPQKISLASHLCDDLNVVLSSTRIQQLHWNLERNEMFTRCRNYIEQYKDLKLMLSKELEYLNIDYNQFKDMPGINYADDPYAGVEKGYEHFIEFSDEDGDDFEDDIRSDSSRNRCGRPRKSIDSQDSRSRKFDSDNSEDYVPPSSNVGRPRKPVDPNAPKNKVGRPRKIIDDNQLNRMIKDKKRVINPLLKSYKVSDLIDLTKSDSNSSDERSPRFNLPKSHLPSMPFLNSSIQHPLGSFGVQSRVLASVHSQNFPISPVAQSSGNQYHSLMSGAIHYPITTGATSPVTSVTIPSVTSSTIPPKISGAFPLMSSGIMPPITSSTIPPKISGAFPLISSGTIPPITSSTIPSKISGAFPLISSGTIPSITSGTFPLISSGTVPPVTSSTIPPKTSGAVPLISSGTVPPVTSSTIPPKTSGAVPLISSGTVPSVTSCTMPLVSSGKMPLTTFNTIAPVTSGMIASASVCSALSTTVSSDPNTVKTLRAFRPMIRKQEKTLFSSPLLSSTNQSLKLSQTSSSYQNNDTMRTFGGSTSISTYTGSSSMTRPIGNLNPGTIAMRNYLAQKYSNIQANIPATSTQVPLTSTIVFTTPNFSSTSHGLATHIVSSTSSPTTVQSIGYNISSTLTPTIREPTVHNLSSTSTTLGPTTSYNLSSTSRILGPTTSYNLISTSTELEPTTSYNLGSTLTTLGPSTSNNLSSISTTLGPTTSYNLNSTSRTLGPTTSYNLSSTSTALGPTTSYNLSSTTTTLGSTNSYNLSSTSTTIGPTISYNLSSTSTALGPTTSNNLISTLKTLGPTTSHNLNSTLTTLRPTTIHNLSSISTTHGSTTSNYLNSSSAILKPITSYNLSSISTTLEPTTSYNLSSTSSALASTTSNNLCLTSAILGPTTSYNLSSTSTALGPTTSYNLSSTSSALGPTTSNNLIATLTTLGPTTSHNLSSTSTTFGPTTSYNLSSISTALGPTTSNNLISTLTTLGPTTSHNLNSTSTTLGPTTSNYLSSSSTILKPTTSYNLSSISTTLGHTISYNLSSTLTTLGPTTSNNLSSTFTTLGPSTSNNLSSTSTTLGPTTSYNLGSTLTTVGPSTSNNLSSTTTTTLGSSTSNNLSSTTTTTLGSTTSYNLSSTTTTLGSTTSYNLSSTSTTLGPTTSNNLISTSTILGSTTSNNLSSTSTTLGPTTSNNLSLTSTTLGSTTSNNLSLTSTTLGSTTSNNLSLTSTTVQSTARNSNSTITSTALVSAGYNSGSTSFSTTLGSPGYNLDSIYQMASSSSKQGLDALRLHTKPCTTIPPCLNTSSNRTQSDNLNTSKKFDSSDIQILNSHVDNSSVNKPFHDRQILHNLLSKQILKRKIDSDTNDQVVRKKRAYIRRKQKTSSTIQSVITDIRYTSNTNQQINNNQLDTHMKNSHYQNQSITINQTHSDKNDQIKVSETNSVDLESKNQQPTIFQTIDKESTKMNESNQHALISTLLSPNDQIENKIKINESTCIDSIKEQSTSKIDNNLKSTNVDSSSSQQCLISTIEQTKIHMKSNELIQQIDSSNQQYLASSDNNQIKNQNHTKINDTIENNSSTNQQEFVVSSVDQIKNQNESITIDTSNEKFLLPCITQMKSNTETKKMNELTSCDDTKLFDDDSDEFDGLDNLQIEKTISEIEANIKELKDLTTNEQNEIVNTSSNVIDESIDTKNDQKMKQVIEILEQQSDMIANELSNDCEKNVPKTNTTTHVIKSSSEPIDTKHSETFETKFHPKQVYQNSIISQIDFSDLLKSTDSAETKHKTHSEFENLFKNLDDQQHSIKQSTTHSKCDQIIHSNISSDNENQSKHQFSHKKPMEMKSSSTNSDVNLVSPKVESSNSSTIKDSEISKKTSVNLDQLSSPKHESPHVSSSTKCFNSSEKFPDSKITTAWPNSLKNSKDFYNILSDIDQTPPKVLLTDLEIPTTQSMNMNPNIAQNSKDEDPITISSSLDGTSKNDKCDFFSNNHHMENVTTNKTITTFSEAFKSLSDEMSRKSIDHSSILSAGPSKVSQNEQIKETCEKSQNDFNKKLTFAHFFNKSPQNDKDPVITDNPTLKEDISTKQPSLISNSCTELITSIPTQNIVETESITKPLESSNSKIQLPNTFRISNTKVDNTLQIQQQQQSSTPKQAIPTAKSTEIVNKLKKISESKLNNRCKTQQSNIFVSQTSQSKPILTLKTTGSKAQEPSKFITALKVSVSQTSTTNEMKQLPSIVATESKSSGKGLTSLGNSLRFIKEGDEFRLISIPITTPSTKSSVTSCTNTIQSMITEAIKKHHEATAQNNQNQTITTTSNKIKMNSTTLIESSPSTPETKSTSTSHKPVVEHKLKSILKKSVNMNSTTHHSTSSKPLITTPSSQMKLNSTTLGPTKTPQTIFATKILSTPTNIIKPGTSVSVNNKAMKVKSILVAPANILTSKKGTQSATTKLGNVTVLSATAPISTSSAKPAPTQVKPITLRDTSKTTPSIIKHADKKPLILRTTVKPVVQTKPLTTFKNSLKLAGESNTIKHVPKSNKMINITSKKSESNSIINITESDDNIEILAITSPPRKSSKLYKTPPPTTFTNILKNHRIDPPKNNSPPTSPLSIEYENHEGIKETVFVQTKSLPNQNVGVTVLRNDKIRLGNQNHDESKSSDSQSSSSSNETDFTIVHTANGYIEVKPTMKSNLQTAKTFKIEYVSSNQNIKTNDNVPDLVPFASTKRAIELGKHKFMSDNQATSVGTKRFKNNDAGQGCSSLNDSSTQTVEPHYNFQESTGGTQNNIPSTNNVSIQQTTTIPTLSTIVTSSNIVQNSLNTTNGSTVSVVRSTSAIINNSTTLSSSNTDTPTLVNMLIHRPTIRATNQEITTTSGGGGTTRLKQCSMYQQQQQQQHDEESTVTSTPISNIIRATSGGGGVASNPTSIVRGTTSTTGTPHLLSFVNSSQLLKSISTNDGVKPLQLLYKISDGKTYITPVSLSTSSSVKMATMNKQQGGDIVKVEVISPTSKLASTPTTTAVASTARSVFEETYAKFIHIGRTNQTQSVTSSSSSNDITPIASTLPKFQQAFGKTTNFSNNQTTRNNSDQQPLLLVSKMSGASVVTASNSSPIVTSTITSTTTTPITVVPVSIGTSVATSTIQRATSNQVRLIKTTSTTSNNAKTIDNKIECDVDSNASNDSLPSSGGGVVNNTQQQTVCIQQSGQQQSQTVLTPMRLALPIVQRTAGGGGIPTTRVMTPVLLRQRVLLTSGTVGTVGTPIRLPQNARVLTSNMNTLEPAVSSSTLEQLREFDKVFEKVKERSTTVQPTISVTATTVTATVPSTTVSTVTASPVVTNFINKLDNSNADTSDDSTQTSNRSSTPIMATFQTTPHIDTTNLVVGSQQQRVSVAYVSGQLGQTILSSPVVVMQQQPSSTPSPALSVTSQSSSSSPSSNSNANNTISSSKSTPIKLNASTPTKTMKNKPIKPNTQASPLKASPVPKPQQKPQEDEGTAQRIYSILAEYAEQLRNSPDLNNKPAPRRRSNPPANPSQNSKRKKSSSGKKVSTSGGTGSGMEMSPGTVDDHRTIGSEDSSCGVQLHLSQLQDSPSQAMLSMDDAQSTEGSMDIPGMRGLHGMDNSNDCMDRPSSSQSTSAVSAASVSVSTSSAHQTTQHRQLILTDTSNSTGNRNVIITDSVVSEALAQVGKITNTATVLVPGNYLLPMSMVKGGHQITIVSGGSKILAVKPLKLPTTLANSTVGGTSQQITTQVLVPTSNTQKISTQILNRTVVSSSETNLIRTTQSVAGNIVSGGVDARDHCNSLDFNSSGAVLTVQSSNNKNNTILADTSNTTTHRNTTHQLQLQVNDPTTISGSNGPLLSQLCNELNDTGNHSSSIILTDTSASNVINVSPIHNGKVERDCIDNTKNNFKKNWSTNSNDQIDHQSGASPIFRHSPGMQYATSTIDTTQSDKKSRTINNNNQKQLSIQAQRKQAAIERELRLQKSLSEECEDLGVDEPSASDLFPEAEILFDNTNQSPSFGANVLLQDVVTTTCSNDDDNIFTNALDNGSSRDMTTASSQDIKNKLNDHIDYLLVQKNKINKNGTTKFHTNVVAQCSNSSQSSYEDTNTLITNTPLISDVTIPSPLPQSTSYCLPSPYRAESPLTQATHSHLYTYSKKSNTKLATKKGRSYSLFESDCEISSSSHDDTNSRTSSTSADQKDNDSLSDSASEAQSDNNTRKYSRKRPYKLYVYDENGVDASSFTCDKDDTHDTSTHLNNTPSSDNNDESMSAMSTDMMEGMMDDSSESSPHSILSDSDLASISSGLRRASKRGHVRKGCPCCTTTTTTTTTTDTTSPPTKRKFGKKGFTTQQDEHHATTKKISGKKIS